VIDVAWAQAAPGAPPAWGTFVPLLLVFGVFYFLLIRPQQQKAKAHQTMLANLKKNDEVVTSGGLHGTVIEIGDRIVKLEIARNVIVRVSRAQISDVITATKGGEPKEGKGKG
jgi:preprotein translocase subunit YajC